MEEYKIPSYLYIHTLCKLSGLLVTEKSWIRKCRAYVICFLTAVGVIIHMFQLYVILTSKLEMQPIMELVTTCLPVFSFSACYYNMLYNLHLVTRIIDHVANSVDNLENDEEVNVVKKYAEQTQLYSLLLACVFYLYIGICFLPSFYSLYLYASDEYNDTILVLPVQLSYCFKNRIEYFFMLLLEYASIIIICSVGIAYYTMAITCLQHACALFSVATVRIDRSLNDCIEKSHFTSFASKSRKQSEWIIPVIECYTTAVDFVNLLLAACQKSYCVEIMMAFLFLVMDFLHVFRFLDMSVTREEAVRNSIYVIGSIMMIYVAFYMGQRLIDRSSDVYAKCCQVPFYTLSSKGQKLLIMLMMRSSKPCSINVNGMMVTSHEVFAKIANTSYSLAIVCYNLR